MFLHISLCRKANGLTEDEQVGEILAGKLRYVCL